MPHISRKIETWQKIQINQKNQNGHLSKRSKVTSVHRHEVEEKEITKVLEVRRRGAAEVQVVADSSIWGQFDLLLADLDGVVYEGARAIPNAVPAINSLQAAKVQIGYVTNNSSRKPETIAEQLRGFGLHTEAQSVISSGLTAVELLAEKIPAGGKVLVVGGEGLRYFVSSAGFKIVQSSEDQPVAVVQGFAPDVAWKDLAEASFAIQNGAIWIATNSDWTLPQERGIAPGNGTLVSAVHTAVGQFPIVAGKPKPAIFNTALNVFKPKAALFVGDRLETDVLGAKRAGVTSAIVLTGIATKKDLLAAKPEERPEYILDTLSDLLTDYPKLKQTKRGWRCGDADVELLGDKVLVVEGDPRSIDALRAACSVIWNAEKHIHFLDVQKELFSKEGIE
ncbi:MAG: HAD-IIA family hydrolase [Micrococcales bacterium]|nr:HAD-IIA family hydrolase [Micrococcales bacterium]